MCRTGFTLTQIKNENGNQSLVPAYLAGDAGDHDEDGLDILKFENHKNKKTKPMKKSPFERELKRSDGTVYAVERDNELCCGHVERGVPVKIPYAHATGLYCYKCKAWVALLKTLLTLTLITGLTAQAIPIPVNLTIDLGGSAAGYENIEITLPQLAGQPVAGDQYTLDADFLGDQFVRLYTRSPDLFGLFLLLNTDYNGVPAFADGTGYVKGAAGQALQADQDMGSASSDRGMMFTVLFPLRSGELFKPVDFYGFHMAIDLPAIPDATITSASLHLSGGPFGVGPQLPDAGSTAWLLGLAAMGLAGFRRFMA